MKIANYERRKKSQVDEPFRSEEVFSPQPYAGHERAIKLIPPSVKRQKNNETCKQPLCINRERNCFMKFHHIT